MISVFFVFPSFTAPRSLILISITQTAPFFICDYYSIKLADFQAYNAKNAIYQDKNCLFDAYCLENAEREEEKVIPKGQALGDSCYFDKTDAIILFLTNAPFAPFYGALLLRYGKFVLACVKLTNMRKSLEARPTARGN